MKKIFPMMAAMGMILSLTACGITGNLSAGSLENGSAGSEMETASTGTSETEAGIETEEEAASSQEDIQNWVRELGFDAEGEERNAAEARQISVQFEENQIICELNEGTAADSFYEQLPLTIEVEDYSTNEKIFYPPQPLDTGDSPLAQAGAGTLAYYEPWGDVVFFYGDYNETLSLFELGQVISGAEMINVRNHHD